MYRQHWGLDRRPFQDDTSTDVFFRSDTYQSALLKLQYVIENRLGVGLLSGDAGCGKSTVLRELPRALPEQSGPIIEIPYPRLSPRELLGSLARELSGRDDLDAVEESLDRTVAVVGSTLQEFTESGRHPIIIIDDAHTIDDPDVFSALQLLLNFRKPGVCDFALLFAGEPTLLPRLMSFPSLIGHIIVKALVRPLTRHETVAYVGHRLKTAGAADEIFDSEAVQCIHELTGGVPLQINHLCELSLLVGYVDRSPSIHIEQVLSVAEELPALAGMVSHAGRHRVSLREGTRTLRR